MKAFVLVLTSIFFAPVACAQQGLSASAKKIKILSWNIYMLPGWLGHGNVPRAEAIGQQLASGDYDVIVFQEAFHKRARKKINRLLKPVFPFQCGPDRAFSLKANSGLWILSKYPIINSSAITYKTRYGIDAMSRKGGLLAEIKIQNQTLQVVATHLQNFGDDWRRLIQCEELYKGLLKEYQRPGVPQIVCGDFNIDRHDQELEYRLMLQALDADDQNQNNDNVYSYDGMNNDLLKDSGQPRDLIDYILVRPNLAITDKGQRRIRIFRQQWHPGHRDLSDHFSVETEFDFQPPAVLAVSGNR